MKFLGKKREIAELNYRLAISKEPRVIKKKTAVKPKNLKELAKGVVAAPKVRQDFTFFDTLDDVNLVRYVNLNGTVVEKGASGTPTKVKPPQEPKIITPQPPQSLSTPEVVPIPKPKIEKLKSPALVKLEKIQGEKKGGIHIPVALTGQNKTFRVQVSSFRESDMARSLEAHLKTKGYPAFYKAVTLAEKGTWYRVYLGEYAEKKDAQKTAQLARERDRLKPVIIRTAAN